MELLIWAGGRWRRVCAASGRVAGWRRRARYVCSSRGTLRELAPLAALRSIVKGPHLPKQRNDVRPKPTVTGNPYYRYGKTAQSQLPILQKDASIQTDTDSVRVASNKPIQITQTSPQKLISQDDKENQVSRTHKKRLRCASTDKIVTRPSKQQKIDETDAKDKQKALQNITDEEQRRKYPKSQRNDTQRPVEHHTTDSLKSSEEEFISNDKTEVNAKRKPNKTITVKERSGKPISQTSTTGKLVKDTTDSHISSDEDQYKELIIDEEDVLLLRQYIETHDTGIDLLKFDENDNYKMSIFYKINPLVRLERCPQIANMLNNRDANVTIHFARQLGLRSVAESEDSERGKHKKPKYRAAKALAMARSINQLFDSKKKVKEVTISLLNESDTEDEKRSKKKTVKQSRVARSDIESDSEKYEAKKTRRNRSESSDSDVFQVRRIKKRATKEMTKFQSESDEGRPKKNETKSDREEQRRNKNKKTFIAPNNTDDINVKKYTKQDADPTKQDDRQNGFKKAFIKYNSEKKPSKQVKKNKNDDFEQNHSKDAKRSALLRHIMPKRSSVPPGREYSVLEDQAIVAWLSASTERERAVNGNRLWRELQGAYTKLTGQRRSWHSLRNRYLRYILPGLASLALPTEQAQRLRAHASLGELKSRKQLRRNSVFNLPPVRSASARNRPPRAGARTPPAAPSPPPTGRTEHTSSSSDSQESSPKRRVLRSSSAFQRSPSANLRARTPQQLAQSSAQLHKSPTRSPSKGRTTFASKPLPRRTRSPRPSPSYSELTRRLLRNRSTPQHSPQPPAAATQHKRRLYNPRRPPSSGSSQT